MNPSSPAIGQTDLIAFFIRRNYNIIQNMGFCSLITTNTISEGDTRTTALNHIIEKNGNIIFAIKQIKWPGVANLFVSLISLRKGEWKNIKQLNGNKVNFINSYLADDALSNPNQLVINKNILFKGDDFAGEGFILGKDEAESLLKSENNHKVIFPLVNGREVNDNYIPTPKRYIINFGELSENEAKEFTFPFSIVEERVKPQRLEFEPINSWNRKVREYWWQFGALRRAMHEELIKTTSCFVFSVVTKYLSLFEYPSNYIFSNAVYVIAKSNWHYFVLVQSTIHLEWTRKYCSKLETRLRYSNTDVFHTFPHPQNLSTETETELEQIGESYHEFRRHLMLKIKLGLTKTYNQFHNPQLSNEIANSDITNRKELQKKFGKETVNLWNHLNKTDNVCSLNEAIADIKHLRQLHKEMDETVLSAYGWDKDSEKCGPALNLAHDFYEVDYLPENDRVRYTISPEARKEVLKRLLLLNHEIYEEEVKQGLHDKNKQKEKAKKEKQVIEVPGQGRLFGGVQLTHKKLSGQKHTKEGFRVGQEVNHPKFGQGIIKIIEGSGDDEKLTIVFSGGVEKKLMSNFAGLENK